MPDEEGLPTAGDVIEGDPSGPHYTYETGKDIYLTIAKQPIVKLARKPEERTTFWAATPGGAQSSQQISLEQWQAIEGLTAEGLRNFGVLPSGEVRFYRTSAGRVRAGQPILSGGSGMAGFDIAGLIGGVLQPVINPLIGKLSQKLYGSRAAGTYGGLTKAQYKRSLLPYGQNGTGIPPPPLPMPGPFPWGFGGGVLNVPPEEDPGAYQRRVYEAAQDAAGARVLAGTRGWHWSRKAGKFVKNRRMNICNPRALSRAMRRVKGFAGFAKSCITFTKQHKMRKGKKKCRY